MAIVETPSHWAQAAVMIWYTNSSYLRNQGENMPVITFQEITAYNWYEVGQLRVFANQADWIAPNFQSLVEAGSSTRNPAKPVSPPRPRAG